MPRNANITAVKKRHAVRNTVMSILDKAIFFLGGTFSGHTHDYTMLKEEFPPEKGWFQFLHVLVDSGYQGIVSDYRALKSSRQNAASRRTWKNTALCSHPRRPVKANSTRCWNGRKSSRGNRSVSRNTLRIIESSLNISSTWEHGLTGRIGCGNDL